MKISKPRSNQLLLEDEAFEKFKLDVEARTGLKDSEYNEDYEGLVLGYRLPGMDASKQMMYGSKISIMTLLCSMTESLIRGGIIDKEELVSMVDTIIKIVDGKM